MTLAKTSMRILRKVHRNNFYLLDDYISSKIIILLLLSKVQFVMVLNRINKTTYGMDFKVVLWVFYLDMFSFFFFVGGGVIFIHSF